MTVPERFLAFFDDAPTFPPGLAPLDVAITRRRARQSNPLQAAVGPLVLSAGDLMEANGLAAGGEPIPVSVVVGAGELGDVMDQTHHIGPGLRVRSIELKTDPTDQRRWHAECVAAQPLLPVFVELTASQIDDGALHLLDGDRLRLKYRTGGVSPELFPSPEQLAMVIKETVRQQVPFKLTAGLHEAIRYTNADTGLTHHGFLNIAAATIAAQQGADRDQITNWLTVTEPHPVLEQLNQEGNRWRSAFTSFGTCSVAEPAASLHRLGLFPEGLE